MIPRLIPNALVNSRSGSFVDQCIRVALFRKDLQVSDSSSFVSIATNLASLRQIWYRNSSTRLRLHDPPHRLRNLPHRLVRCQ